MEQEIMHKSNLDTSPIIIYTTEDDNISLDVKLENETVWLNRSQMSLLFGRDIKTIGKHINNALKVELEGLPVVAKFATTASDGKTYQVEHYVIEIDNRKRTSTMHEKTIRQNDPKCEIKLTILE